MEIAFPLSGTTVRRLIIFGNLFNFNEFFYLINV